MLHLRRAELLIASSCAVAADCDDSYQTVVFSCIFATVDSVAQTFVLWH